MYVRAAVYRAVDLVGFYQHKAHFKVRVEEKASQRSKQYPSVLVDHAYLWSGFNPKVCQYI